MPNRRQAITRTNADPVHWCIYVALWVDNLKYLIQTSHMRVRYGMFFCGLITLQVFLIVSTMLDDVCIFVESQTYILPLQLYFCNIICKSYEIGPCDNCYANHVILDHVIYISANLVMLNNEIQWDNNTQLYNSPHIANWSWQKSYILLCDTQAN